MYLLALVSLGVSGGGTKALVLPIFVNECHLAVWLAAHRICLFDPCRNRILGNSYAKLIEIQFVEFNMWQVIHLLLIEG